MTKIKEIALSNRMKSLYWRSGMMILAGFISALTDALSGFQLSPQVTIFCGLILGEISKAINSAVKE